MAKKSKNPDTTTTTTTTANTNVVVPTSANIFQTLFGSIEQHHTPLSLFSDANPFRRKPTAPSHPPNPQNPSNGEDGKNPSFVEVKEKKKRKNKEKENPGSDAGLIYETHLEIDKSKEGLVSDEGFGKDRNGDIGGGGYPSFVELKKKKIRKSKERKEPRLDSAETQETDLETKKSKMSGVKSRDFGVELEEGGGGKDLRMEVGVLQEEGEGKNHNVDKKKMKKRKRDEVEAEYEARRYGVCEGGGEEELGGKVVGQKRKKGDVDTMDAVVPKEGFDDEAKLIRTVFVGNLPLKVKKKALLREFSQFGEVDSVRIRSVPLSDVSVA